MTVRAVLALLAAGVVCAAAPAASMPPSQSASVTVSNAKAGMRPVTLTLQLHYEMQCGNPGTGYLRVKLPAQAQLPATLPTNSALLNGRRVSPTLTATKQLRVALPPRPGVMCDVIGPGTLTFVVTKAANIGNPAKAGRYKVAAWSSSKAFATTYSVN